MTAGYIITVPCREVFLPNLWKPFTGAIKTLLTGELPDHWNLLLIIPFFLGFLMFTKSHEMSSWLA